MLSPAVEYTKCRDTHKSSCYFRIDPVKKVQFWLSRVCITAIGISSSGVDSKPDKIYDKEQKTDHGDHSSRE